PIFFLLGRGRTQLSTVNCQLNLHPFRNYQPASSSLSIQLPAILLQSVMTSPCIFQRQEFPASAPTAVKSHQLVSCNPIGNNLKIKVV
ncbi:MAG: hypothetical protein ACMG55_11300, partial [Microcoleus sp.]